MFFHLNKKPASFTQLGSCPIETTALVMSTVAGPDDIFSYMLNDRVRVYIKAEDDGSGPVAAMSAVIPVLGTEITLSDSGDVMPLTLEFIHDLIPDPQVLGSVFKNQDKDTLYRTRHNGKMDLTSIVSNMACTKLTCSPDFLTALSLAVKHAHDIVVCEGLIYQYDGSNYVNTELKTVEFVTKSLIGLDGQFIVATSIKNSTFSAVTSMFELIMFIFNMTLKVDFKCPHVIRCKDAMFVNGVITEPSANMFSRKYFPATLYGMHTLIPGTPVQHVERILQWMRVLFIQNDCIHWMLSLLRKALCGRNYKVAVFLIGTGNSGKTTFLEFIKRAFGSSACSFNAGSITQMSGENARPDLVKLLSHNIAIAEECTRLNPETFKLLSGNDSEVHLRGLHSNGTTGAVTSTMFFAMNDWPRFDTFPDKAVMNRMCPFRLDTDMTRFAKTDYFTEDFYSALFRLAMNSTWEIQDFPAQVLKNRDKYMTIANRNTNQKVLGKIDEYKVDPHATEIITPAQLEIPNDPTSMNYWSSIITSRGGQWCKERQGWYGLSKVEVNPIVSLISPLEPLLVEHIKPTALKVTDEFDDLID